MGDLKLNINGSYQKAKEVYSNINGTWRKAKGMWVNINGMWKPIFESDKWERLNGFAGDDDFCWRGNPWSGAITNGILYIGYSDKNYYYFDEPTLTKTLKLAYTSQFIGSTSYNACAIGNNVYIHQYYDRKNFIHHINYATNTIAKKEVDMYRWWEFNYNPNGYAIDNTWFVVCGTEKDDHYGIYYQYNVQDGQVQKISRAAFSFSQYGRGEIPCSDGGVKAYLGGTCGTSLTPNAITLTEVNHQTNTATLSTRGPEYQYRGGYPVAFYNNDIYCIGGDNADNGRWSWPTVNKYNRNTQTWSNLKDIDTQGLSGGRAYIINDKIYVTNGYGPNKNFYRYYI